MKKLIAILVLCAMAFAFTSCDVFEEKTQILGVVSVDGFQYINSELLKSDTGAYETELINSDQSKITNDLLLLLEKEPFAIVIIGDIEQKEVIDTLKANNTPVIFVGSVSDYSALDLYDKAWSLTANEKQGGEMLGVEIGDGFKSGLIVDQNGDGILQNACVYANKTSAFNSIIQSAEDLGVYSEVAEIQISDLTDITTINNLVFEKYNNAIAPELIICESEELALAIQHAFLLIEQPINVAFVHKDFAPLTITNPPLYNASQYPFSDVTNACVKFINNILKKETINYNTDIRLNSHKTSVFSYILTN